MNFSKFTTFLEEIEDHLTNNIYLKLIRNQYTLSGRPRPYTCTITKCVGSQQINEMIKEIVECFTLPLRVKIDFWAVLTSSSR